MKAAKILFKFSNMAKFSLNLRTITKRSNSILNKKFRLQLLATLTVSILTFSHGVGLGWLSPTLSKLQSDLSPLYFSVSINEASWIGSLLGLGSMCGNIIMGILQNIVGRKVTIYFLAVPHICLWILIYCAQSVEFLMIGRFLGGFTGGGCYVTLPLFISEIADPNIRGTLSAMLMLSVNFGILFGFILSSHLNYHLVPFLTLCFPIVYLIGSYFFPETPQYLLRREKFEEAETSFRFYTNFTNEDKSKDIFDNFKSNNKKTNQQDPLSYRDFVTKPAIKSIITAGVLLFVNQFSGIFAFVNYMSNIFANSGSAMDSNTSTIIMGVLQIAGTCTATLLVDTCGRKILMLCSTGGMSAGLAIFGAFTYYSRLIDLSNYSFVPIVLMGFVVFIGNLGMIALTFVVLIEIFPPKIRPIAASVSMTTLSFLVFAMLKIFPLFMDAFGISITMWSCSTVCACSFVYLFIFLDETKGKSMDCH